MANFNVLERKLASLLRNNPELKRYAKKTYQHFSYLIYKKKYKVKSKYYISLVNDCSDESFFGYYDNNPRRGNLELYHTSSISTAEIPINTLDSKGSCFIIVRDLNDASIKIKVKTNAYNWQQGSKLQWVSDDSFIYNDVIDGSIKSKLINVNTHEEKIFDDAVYDSFNDSFFLSIDYRPLTSLRPDYAYFNKQGWGEINFESQSIKKVTFDGHFEVILNIVTLNEMFPLGFECCYSSQKFNHIMISNDGNKAIFLHRAYNKSGVRIDRLFSIDISNSNKLHLISDSGMISHYCWVDSDTILAYMTHDKVNGYYFINIVTNDFRKVDAKDLDHYGDGHPTYIGDGLFITDTYPDKSRMKSLLLVDTNTHSVKVIAEFFEPLKFNGQTRCDLHPKWDPIKRVVYVDSVHNGIRQLFKLGLEK